MFNIFPFTNFHDLNMDWIIKTIKMLWTKSVFSVNNTEPDENGNVNLPTVAGVSSVNGIGADGQGNVQLSASNVGAIPNTTPIVSKVNSKSGDITISDAELPVFTTKSDPSYFNSSVVNVSTGQHVARFVKWKNVINADFEISIIAALSYNSQIMNTGTFPEPVYPVPFVVSDRDTGLSYTIQIRSDGGVYAAQSIPANVVLAGAYTYLEKISNNSLTVTN